MGGKNGGTRPPSPKSDGDIPENWRSLLFQFVFEILYLKKNVNNTKSDLVPFEYTFVTGKSRSVTVGDLGVQLLKLLSALQEVIVVVLNCVGTYLIELQSYLCFI